MNQRDESTIVEVDGKSLRLTHWSSVIFPDDGLPGLNFSFTTKRNALSLGLKENHV